MSKFDDLIGQALTEEDRALLASHAEPGYLSQAMGLFRGPMSWVMWLVNVANGVSFLVGVYALWQMVNATDALLAVKWGIGALFLFQITTLCKTFMGNRMEANRMLREIKRVELQLSLLRADAGASE
ncbi:hypothetical protein DFR29_10222 [Tahibacter aquaticus]|uniref:Uncharacterized protein n=1 Tax=Tahibacter aquaticus TaxID=520092 RepID=A0A4R6Z6I1_9GAMM|nr:DUF6768 family protein [Tahibacter aquaticus]TDR47363.1 hypothetical protein DFR29_10222 [Tahibacter aquaticus]